jgi:hypothetical protein
MEGRSTVAKRAIKSAKASTVGREPEKKPRARKKDADSVEKRDASPRGPRSQPGKQRSL